MSAPPLPPPVLFHYSLPKGKPLIFDKLFRYNDRGTEMLLQTVVQKRSDFINWLQTPTTPEAGIQVCMHACMLLSSVSPAHRAPRTGLCAGG